MTDRWLTTEELAAIAGMGWYMLQMEGRAMGHAYACGLNYGATCTCKPIITTVDSSKGATSDQ